MAYVYQSNIQLADQNSQLNLLPKCTRVRPDSFLSADDYSEYIISCLTTVYKDNLTMYKFPKGFKFYYGEPTPSKETVIPKNRMSFSINAHDAGQQGVVYEFVLQKELQVVSLDRKSNIEVLVATALLNNQQEVVNALSLEPDQRSIDDQLTLIDYLCDFGYNGFGYRPFKQSVDRGIPATFVICQAEQYLGRGRVSPLSEQFVTSIQEAHLKLNE